MAWVARMRRTAGHSISDQSWRDVRERRPVASGGRDLRPGSRDRPDPPRRLGAAGRGRLPARRRRRRIAHRRASAARGRSAARPGASVGRARADGGRRRRAAAGARAEARSRTVRGFDRDPDARAVLLPAPAVAAGAGAAERLSRDRRLVWPVARPRQAAHPRLRRRSGPQARPGGFDRRDTDLSDDQRCVFRRTSVARAGRSGRIRSRFHRWATSVRAGAAGFRQCRASLLARRNRRVSRHAAAGGDRRRTRAGGAVLVRRRVEDPAMSRTLSP